MISPANAWRSRTKQHHHRPPWRCPSSLFATFQIYYVDGEAIEQEDDECFGVARCHGFSSMNSPNTQ
jgi:hypothetical protein